MLEVGREHFEARRLASQDSARPGITRVRFEPTCTVATNGHVLVKVDRRDDKPATFEPFHLSPDNCKRAMACGTPKSPPFIDESNVNGSLKVVGAKGEISIPTADQDMGPYPQYDKVIPEHTDSPTFEVGIDLEYLADLAAIFKAAGNTRVRLQFSDTISAIRIEGLRQDCRDASHVTAVLMPIRLK